MDGSKIQMVERSACWITVRVTFAMVLAPLWFLCSLKDYNYGSHESTNGIQQDCLILIVRIHSNLQAEAHLHFYPACSSTIFIGTIEAISNSFPTIIESTIASGK